MHYAGERSDVVGGHNVAVALGLNDELATQRRAAIEDNAVDPVIARTAGHPCILTTHREQQLPDQLFKRERIHNQEICTSVKACRHIDRRSELIFGKLEGEK